MRTHSKPDPKNQDLSRLLENWQPVIVRKPETRAGRYVISRFPVPPGHADLIASLAGLGADQ